MRQNEPRPLTATASEFYTILETDPTA